MPVSDQEDVPGHVLVLPDAAGHEIACAFGYFCESRLEIGKVDPLLVWEDLITVENGPACQKVAAPPGKGRVAGLR